MKKLLQFFLRGLGLHFIALNYYKILKLYGINWKIPVIDTIGKSHADLHEDFLYQHYHKILSAADAFIDIGANLGQTIIKIKTIRPQLPYYAFEPSVFCVNYIQHLVSLNNIGNFELFPIGLSDTNTVLDFFITSAHSQGNSIIKNIRKQGYKKKVSIPVFKFDEVAAKIGTAKNMVIKIDVEGAEYLVLEGMRTFLTQHKPLLVMEFLRITKADNEYLDKEARDNRILNQTTSEKIFGELGYKKYCLLENGTIEGVYEIGFNEDTMRTNYLLAHEDTDLSGTIYSKK